MKNTQIKKAHAADEYTPHMVAELLKCTKDPVHFLRNYIKIQHPTKGNMNFDMYEYQERYVRHLNDNRFVITLMARQQGKTLTTAMYLLWYAAFTPDVTVLIASKNQSHALEIAARIRFAYENLPNWLKPGVKYYNRHNLEMDNGSRIISEATTEKTGRGLSISCVTGNTTITVKNKKTGKIETLSIDKFLNANLSINTSHIDVDVEG